MIQLRTSRNYLSAIRDYFFPLINLSKNTRLKDVEHHGKTSKEYLSAVVINCLVGEVEHLIEKKLVNTSSHKAVLKLTEAQAIVLYHVLLHFPLHSNNIYLQMVRNEWIQSLDGELHKQNSHSHLSM